MTTGNHILDSFLLKAQTAIRFIPSDFFWYVDIKFLLALGEVSKIDVFLAS